MPNPRLLAGHLSTNCFACQSDYAAVRMRLLWIPEGMALHIANACAHCLQLDQQQARDNTSSCSSRAGRIGLILKRCRCLLQADSDGITDASAVTPRSKEYQSMWVAYEEGLDLLRERQCDKAIEAFRTGLNISPDSKATFRRACCHPFRMAVR